MVMMQDFRDLGKIGEIVSVRRTHYVIDPIAGYARNFLYPNQIAKYATDANISKFVLSTLAFRQLEKLKEEMNKKK